MTDTSELAEKILYGVGPELRELCEGRIEALNAMCQSPIEVALGAAIWTLWDSVSWLGHQMLAVVPAHQIEDGLNSPGFGAVLVPQFQVEQYRADFLIIWRADPQVEIRMLIECDGHDFHERTKEQAASDKRRDRALQTVGYPVLRFTGSEIHKDPVGRAREVINALGNALGKELTRRHRHISKIISESG